MVDLSYLCVEIKGRTAEGHAFHLDIIGRARGRGGGLGGKGAGNWKERENGGERCAGGRDRWGRKNSKYEYVSNSEAQWVPYGTHINDNIGLRGIQRRFRISMRQQGVIKKVGRQREGREKRTCDERTGSIGTNRTTRSRNQCELLE